MEHDNTVETVIYELRIPGTYTQSGKDIRVARFTVEYMDRSLCGPRDDSTHIITDREIARNYTNVIKQDFNFGKKPASAAVEYLDQHLNWDEASYGYTYVSGKLPYQRVVNNPFPYYGEYCLTNRVGTTAQDYWLDDTPQHGGAANGYCMYVDGGRRPGLVASISTEQRICSGQQLYCYAWICNPSKDAAGITANSPIFRFNVQGRNKDADGNYGDWEDIGVFFAGSLPYAGGEAGWRQVFFPLVSANDYDESRVSIYNFANSNQGNDFLIDDICLFASKLPLAAYQVMTSCASENREAAIARVDYTRLTGDWGCQPIYYQLYDLTANTPVPTNYYNRFADEESDTTRHGCIIIPQSDYDPAKTRDPDYRQDHTCMKNVDESRMVFPSITAFVDSMGRRFTELNEEGGTVINEVTMKAYVPTMENGDTRYVLYVGHILSNSKLDAAHTYEIRMARDTNELSNPDCVLRTPLPVYDKTALNINNQTSPVVGACANDLYPVEVRVTNTIDDNKTIFANAKADWLLAYSFDDIFDGHTLEYGSKFLPTSTEKETANALFLSKYGHDRGKVEDAIKDMRRLPTDTVDNPNYYATDVSQLDPRAFHNEDAYPIIKDLCDRGLLRLNIESESFYMAAADTVRYWIYPILGTAVYTDPDTGKKAKLTDCDEPVYLYISTDTTKYVLNLSPIPYDRMTEHQRAQLPNVRVSASMANTLFCVPVSDIDSVSLGWDSCQVVGTTDPVIAPLIGTSDFSMHYTQDKIWQLLQDNTKYYQSGDTIRFRPVDQAHVDEMMRLHETGSYPDHQPGLWHTNTHTMRPGYEYTMRLQLLDRATSLTQTNESTCKVGFAYFNVLVIPDTMVWRPAYGNEWGDDRNWRAVVNGKEQDYGFAPLPQTLVIIPQLESENVTDYPHITTSNLYPMDANYVPNRCRKIHFNPLTRLLNQHMLTYDSAFVDMTLPQSHTYFVSAPMQDMYSGDIFVPHSGNMYNGSIIPENDDFEVSPFEGTRASNAAYAFYPSYYNRTVSIIHNRDNQSTVTGTAAFNWSNSLDEPLSPGMGYAISGYGPNTDKSNLNIRLPKPDKQYFYFDENGDIDTSHPVNLSRTNAYKLAYPLNGNYTFTITNTEADTTFFFGNPTMAYIDMQRFVQDNTSLRDHFRTLTASEWHTVSLKAMSDPTQRFIAPMQSVILTTTTLATELTLNLRPEHLTISLFDDAAYGTPDSKAQPARRAPADGHIVQSEVMDIIAYYRGRAAYATLAKLDFAANGYDADEDVPFISSGVEDTGNAVTTPINLYTVAGSQALMADIRSNIGIVPLGFLLKSRADSIYISFHTTANWTSECYFCDALTGTKFPIYNDSRFHIATPADHELRYYIQGPYRETPDTPTDNGTPLGNGNNIRAFSNAPGSITVVAADNIREIHIYDMLGRLQTEIHPSVATALCTLSAPAGIVIVEVILHNGTKARFSVFVG